MNIPETVLYAAIVAFCYFTILYIIAIIIKDNSILDIAGGPSFIVVTWAAYSAATEEGARTRAT